MRLTPLHALVRLRPRRLVGGAMAVIVAVAVLQVMASVWFYEAIDRQTLREDHARRVAELLVVSHRLGVRDGATVPAMMSTRHLDVAVGPRPVVARAGTTPEVEAIRDLIFAWEPSLKAFPIMLDIAHLRGKDHLIGSMRLDHGTWLNFRSQDISARWPIALRAIIMTLVLALICLAASLYVLRLLGKPLRSLSLATARLGEGKPVSLPEAAPLDLWNIGRSFNAMQARINRLIADQAMSFEAISHDLRTPLSRLKMATDFIEADDIKQLMRASTDEMEDMLMSLQRFLRAQHIESVAAPVDLVHVVDGVLGGFAGEAEGRITLDAPHGGDAITYAEPLVLALQPLIENALRHGSKGDVRILPRDGGWEIEIHDDGPGIPPDFLEQILDPFFRLDNARARDTAGFGLGIPTAHRLLQRFGGGLRFGRSPLGGLVAIVRVPASARG